MSDKPDIEAIKARLAELRRADEEYVSVIANRPAMEPEYNYHLRVARREVEAHAPADLAALLAEVERLQRERSEWCDRADVLMTEHMTQMRDLTAEVEALRARLTIDDAMVERAAKANYEADHPGCSWDAWDNSGWGQTLYRDSQRAALLAAGMEEQEEGVKP